MFEHFCITCNWKWWDHMIWRMDLNPWTFIIRLKVSIKSTKFVVLVLLLCVKECFFSFPTHFHCPWETLWKKWVLVAAGHAVVFPPLFSLFPLTFLLSSDREIWSWNHFFLPPWTLPLEWWRHTHTHTDSVISLSVYGFRMFCLWPCKRFCGESHITGNLCPYELCESEISEEPVHFFFHHSFPP